MPRGRAISRLMAKATTDFRDLSDIHKKLLKYGYNKNFTTFIEELKARVIYEKVFE